MRITTPSARRRMLRIAVLFACFALVAAGCGDGTDGGANTSGTDGTGVQVNDNSGFEGLDDGTGETGTDPDGTDWTGGGSDTGDGSTPPIGGLHQCTIHDDCPTATPWCGISELCLECLEDLHCSDDGVCTNGVCVTKECTPGETRCSANTLLTCDATGADWTIFECPGAAGQCIDGACAGCDPGHVECTGKAELTGCMADGSGLYVQSCVGEDVCVQGECVSCYPGTKECDGDFVRTCTDAGQWESTEDCGLLGQSCLAGSCQSPCGVGGKLSNEGCDYWAVDMDNLLDAATSPYGVIVSNLGDIQTTVTISAQDGDGATPVVVATGVVPAGGLEVFEMPQRNMGATGVFWKAIRVQSTSPIVAYQFNPLSNVDVYSNDASLLLPTNTFGTEYIVVSRFEFLGGDGLGGTMSYRGSFSVVANAPDTEVTIVASSKTLSGGGIPGLFAGQSTTVTLQPYQVLNVQSDQVDGDLTGTIITSNKPVGVFGGHNGAIGSNACCADHLEQQLFPVSTWGKTYVAAKSWPRGVEQDYWRVVAAFDGTTFSVDPPVHDVPSVVSLDRGDYYEFQTADDFVIEATEPVMVAQTLPSSMEIGGGPICSSDYDCANGYMCDTFFGGGCVMSNSICNVDSDCGGGHACVCQDGLFGLSCNCEPIGDPALILSAPVEQFRDSYVFLSPANYQDDYCNVVGPASAVVYLDGVQLSAAVFKPIGTTGFKVARIKVADGVHSLEASEPVGLVVYGYDDDVSYGYTAGLSLSDL